MAKLSDMPDRDRERSLRFNNVWRPLGVDEELRVLFLADGACWGAAGMVRAGHDFTDRETDFFSAVAPAIASGDQAGGAIGGAARLPRRPAGHRGRRVRTANCGRSHRRHGEWQDRLERDRPRTLHGDDAGHGRWCSYRQAQAVSAPGCGTRAASGPSSRPAR